MCSPKYIRAPDRGQLLSSKPFYTPLHAVTPLVPLPKSELLKGTHLVASREPALSYLLG
jgi:hypothetical protein